MFMIYQQALNSDRTIVIKQLTYDTDTESFY